MSTSVDTPLRTLRETVRARAENRPGVYRMIGGSGVVIYVGKSKRIRTRLLGYFRARSEDKAWRIIREARRVEWEYVPTEFESLLRELDLIKRYRPQYNVHRKRDGLYSYLKVSGGGAPRLSVARRMAAEPGIYYGPMRGGRRVVEGVRELNDVLQLRDCRAGTPIRFADQRDLFDAESVPLCSRHELRRCLAPCAARCTEREYAERVDQARRFLTGEYDGPIEELTERMLDAAERLEFEHAANLRERLARLDYLRAEFLHQREAMEKLTFAYCPPGLDGEHRVYAIRSGSIRAVHPAPATARQRRRLIAALEAQLTGTESPGEATSCERIEQILLVAHWFRTRPAQFAHTRAVENLSALPLRRDLDRLALA